MRIGFRGPRMRWSDLKPGETVFGPMPGFSADVAGVVRGDAVYAVIPDARAVLRGGRWEESECQSI